MMHGDTESLITALSASQSPTLDHILCFEKNFSLESDRSYEWTKAKVLVMHMNVNLKCKILWK